MNNKNKLEGNYVSEVSYIPGMTLANSDKALKKRKQISCRKKVKFNKEKAARIKALLYDLKYYQCAYCQKWHLTRDETLIKRKGRKNGQKKRR